MLRCSPRGPARHELYPNPAWVSEKTSIVAVGCCFIQVVSRVTAMGEILNCFADVSSAVTLQKQLPVSARSPPGSLGWLVYTRCDSSLDFLEKKAIKRATCCTNLWVHYLIIPPSYKGGGNNSQPGTDGF